MTWATFTTLWVSSTALLLSIGACIAAVRLLRLWRSTSSVALSHRLSELELTVESLAGQVRNMRSRLNMQAYRQRKADNSQEQTGPTDPEQAAAETRARLNDILARRNSQGDGNAS